MNGIYAAFTGRIGKDAEVRSTRDGKPWASFPVAVDAKADSETPTTWVRVALFGDIVGTLAPKLTKGADVYCGGSMPLTARPFTHNANYAGASRTARSAAECCA